MSRIALVNPPYIADYTRNSRCDLVSPVASSWYPIWLVQAGCWLEGKGHKTVLIDAQTEKISRDETVNRIAEFKADIVAIYTGQQSEASDVEFGDIIAEQGRTVVFVGPYASADCGGLLARARKANLAIQKEFDLPLEEIASGADPLETANVWVKDKLSGAVTNTPPRPFYKREILDQFPITSKYIHEHLDTRKYRIPSERYPFIDVMSGRGCSWGRCKFCLWTNTFINGSVYNTRSIEHFMQEFEYIYKQMPFIKSVMIQDDMITNKRAAEIAEALLRGGYKIKWSCYAKPNSKLTPETLQLMKRSGCLNLHVGFESGNNEILCGIDKGTTVEQALEFSKQVHAAGLRICGEFTFGHFGETLETMQDTLNFAKAINPHLAHFLVMIPLKGTPFWKKLEEMNSLNEQNQPSYEKNGGPSAEEITSFAKRAYLSFYLRGKYLKNVITSPIDLFFRRLGIYARVASFAFWGR